jgi:hypothetical protein
MVSISYVCARFLIAHEHRRQFLAAKQLEQIALNARIGQGQRGQAGGAIVSVTALPHMPLDRALQRLSAALRPGGVLAAVALPRRDLPHELPAELLAAVGHRLSGVIFAGLRSAGRQGRPRAG